MLSPTTSSSLPPALGQRSPERSARPVTPFPKAFREADTAFPQRTPQDVTAGELQERLIGREIARTAWVDGQARQRLLRDQSERVARRLEGQGITAFQAGGGVSMVGMCTGMSERPIAYRNTNLIPSMQSRNVHEMMKHVRYFCDVTPAKQLRMFVISGGWVSLEDYREAHSAFGRSLSRLAAEPWLRDAGVDLAYFNIEVTIHRDQAGRPMLNMHSHVLARVTKRLGPKKWPLLVRRIAHAFPKGYCHDSRLQSPAECVKYVFKPTEFEALTDPEFAELFRQTYRLKFFHPLGELREMRRKLRAEGRKLLMVPTADDRWVWRVTPARAVTCHDDVGEEGAELSPEMQAAQELMLQPGDPEERNREEEPNQVLAVTAPMPKFSPRFEPCMIVRNYTGDFQALLDQEDVRAKIEQARRLWDARLRREAASMEHTTTTTVGRPSPRRQSPPALPMLQVVSGKAPPPPPAPPWWFDPETGEVFEGQEGPDRVPRWGTVAGHA